MANATRSQKEEADVERWNLAHVVGTHVMVATDGGKIRRGQTTSAAYMAGGHSAVVHVSGISGYYLLSRVTADPLAAKHEEAIMKAVEWFNEYEQHHRQKPDHEKADRNKERAAFLQAALDFKP